MAVLFKRICLSAVQTVDALLLATAESLGADAVTVSADKKLSRLAAEMGMQCLDRLDDRVG